MNLTRAFFKHFGHPHGFWGRVVALRLNISNRWANAWTLSLLDLRAADRVLEVGFGSGLTLQRAAARVPQGWAAGIDRSPTMLEIARRRNAAAIAGGRVELKLGEMAALPYADNCFDKAYAVQVINYVPDLLLGLQELCRVLKLGGRAALFFEPKDKFEQAKTLIEGIYTPYAADEVVALLRQAGFVRAWSETTILSRRPVQTEGICALGEKALS